MNLISRIDLSVRRRLIRFFGIRSKENYHLDSPVVRRRNDVDRIGIYSNPISFVRRSLTESEDFLSYSFPRRYIYRINGAIIDPINNIVYDSEGKLIAESSSWPTLRLLCEHPRPFVRKPRRKILGEHIYYPVTPNYYHWLLEDLPVFVGVERFLKAGVGIIKPANVLFAPADFVLNGFEAFPICSIKEPVQVESLIMASKTSGLGAPFIHNTLHPKDVKIVRDWFLNNYSGEIIKKSHDKIYVSRVGLRRSPVGEKKLIDSLIERGFYIFDGKASLLEQIALFQGCKFLLAASGAALTNIIWMPPGSKVVKLTYGGERFHFFHDLAQYSHVEMEDLDVLDSVVTDSVVCSVVNKIESIVS